ncbi:SCO family protein [Swaminathania salitolerans]|uniref:Electron transporter SenC n=1 Tax=Swaminathania salitolerans TaxID=182838 RepID=A0A511BR39_9PROT|nr:SCO family protein [Swaminathania salitolerans]GBQ12300.1 electron transport transmembrane protein Sco1/SenC/PrrC [Swaminathania salitolerans LMG 21291]GEL02801.1 electron transporter SenC [Swaminathania salitolerans]
MARKRFVPGPSRSAHHGSRRAALRLWAVPTLVIIGLFAGAIGFRTLFGHRHETQIGGAYSLIDSTNRPVTQARFAGRQTLIYFGYTHCLDVCPLTLATVAQAYTLLPPDRQRPVPLFITLDPERDRPDDVGLYARRFSPAIVGLTGTASQIRAVAQAFHVTSHITTDPSGDDASSAYRIDHSSVLYLMDGQNRLQAILPADSSPATVARRLLPFLAKR